MTIFRLLLVVPLVLLPGCGRGKGRFDGRTRSVLAGATHVEVFRIDGNKNIATGDRASEGERRIGGYLVTAQVPDLGKEFADKLAQLLLDDRLYTNRFAKCFEPGVAFRVWKGQESIDVVICFHCDNFYCGPPKPIEMEHASFLGSPLFPQLVRLAKEAFPDDKEIQSLEDQ